MKAKYYSNTNLVINKNDIGVLFTLQTPHDMNCVC